VHHRVRGADHFSTTSSSQNGTNWGHYSEPRVQDLLNQADESFDWGPAAVSQTAPDYAAPDASASEFSGEATV
jgi:uncharacterized protein involved in type VI secretion and phage assembly